MATIKTLNQRIIVLNGLKNSRDILRCAGVLYVSESINYLLSKEKGMAFEKLVMSFTYKDCSLEDIRRLI